VKKSVLVSLACSLATIPIVGYAASLPIRVKYEMAKFNNLPAKLKNLKILHISDLHNRQSNKINVDIWQHILGLDYDIAVFTGDLILDNVKQIYPHLDGIKSLVKKVPVFYVDGNHERWCFSKMAKLLENTGVNVLYNKISLLGNKSVVGFRDYDYLQERDFNGIDSLLSKMAKADRTDNKTDNKANNKTDKPANGTDNFHIILSHQPQIFDYLKQKLPNISGLILAGHTHGGQVKLPLLPTLFAPGQGVLPKYSEGWYQNSTGNLKMFISKGIGTTHFPLRLYNPPEIAIVTLSNA